MQSGGFALGTVANTIVAAVAVMLIGGVTKLFFDVNSLKTREKARDEKIRRLEDAVAAVPTAITTALEDFQKGVEKMAESVRDLARESRKHGESLAYLRGREEERERRATA